jgi:CrcB protein
VIGGALGALARYLISSVVSERFPTRFPFGTLMVNVSGSFIVGLFLTLAADRINIHPTWRLAIVVGFLGAYTTFSTFEYETFRLLETGEGISGIMNVFISLILGFMSVWGGIAVGRRLEIPGVSHPRASTSRFDQQTSLSDDLQSGAHRDLRRGASGPEDSSESR